MKFYTVKETAEMLRVTDRTIFTYIKNGKLPAAKVGKAYRITEEDIKQFMDTLKAETRTSN